MILQNVSRHHHRDAREWSYDTLSTLGEVLLAQLKPLHSRNLDTIL